MLFISYTNIWDKVFKKGLSKFWGRQPLESFKGYGLLSHFRKFILTLSSIQEKQKTFSDMQ